VVNAMGRYLRRATKEDRDLLFRWANDSLVRENSFSTEKISYDEHVKWFDRLLNRNDCIQYIYMDDDCSVGQARITLKDDTAEIGYSICTEKRRLGYGQDLLHIISERVWEDFPDVKKVYGEVKPENIASQKAFLDAGYKETYRVFEMVREEEHN
jgi:RimJ/RimL family protein N-acetyltransferase